ncbi:scavenger receptor cysteine-rich domain-containing protein DMBT1-like, partial [Aulostomus maculatus]
MIAAKKRVLQVSIECEKVRLVGPSRCSGRVEIFHRDSWGTVCDDHWGLANADVVCRELNCGTVLEAKKSAFFGEGKDEIWLDDVQCSGSETSILKCTHRPIGENNCGHSEDAGVICSDNVRLLNGTHRCTGRVEIYHNGHWKKVCSSDWGKLEDNKPIRLMNGTNRCAGRVELYHNGQWGTVCDDRWGLQEASVACREMNCGVALAVKYKAFFGRGQDQVWLDDVDCTGQEKSLSDCPHRGFGEHDCDHSEDAGVVCSGSPSIRLVNGTNRCSGRVEILHDGQWGTVCDDEWDIKDAQVVCRMMDCGTAQLAKSGAFFGQGQGSIWLDDVNCHGNESSLQHCQHMSFGENNCGHGEDASVVCSATIRLIDGMTQCSGRVEVHHEGRWGGAYNVNWGMNEATVVCREMNCGDAVKFSGAFGQGGVERGYKVSCTGRESSLTHCTLRECDRRSQGNVEEVYVECSGNVKLAAGPNRCAGRVEFFDKGQWGTVCGEFWDINDATVVCKQLNCGRAHRTNATNEYGHGSGNFWFEQIECSGSESTLAECPRRPVRDHTCTAETGVAVVICTESLGVRLANSNTECTGRVEVQNGQEWETVCDTDWTLSKAEVVCKLLECGRAVDIPGGAHYGQGSGGVVEATESCFANMTTVEQCAAKGFIKSSCGHEHDAGAVCAAQLRLAGGSSECSGRVEIFYKGQWGTVCDDEWSISNGDVVCGQLGCGHAVAAPGSAHFGRGTGPIWLDNVECTGQETV